MHSLERLFNPRSVAVVGSKTVDRHNWLRTVLPFEGPKFHINTDKNEWPSAEELGFPSYSSILDVPEDVDFVIISVPAAVVPRVLNDCIKKGVAGVHLYTAGYGETGSEPGITLENELAELARVSGINVVGPNCVGIFNPLIGLGVNIGGYSGENGNLAFISHSGSQTIGFSKAAFSHGIRMSKAVSMGNGLVLDTSDYLEYFAQDPDTSVIGMYVEGVRDGRRFFNTLKEVCRKKPVIIWKVGETEESGEVAAGHSTSKPARPEIWDAMVKQCRAIAVEDAGELIETAKLLLHLQPTTGERLGLFALSGGHSTEMANIFSKSGFKVPPLSENSYQQILAHWDMVGSTYRNPLEGRTLGNLDHLNNALNVLNEAEEIDIIVHEINVGAANGDFIPVFRGHNVDPLCAFKSRSSKPYVVAISTSSPQGEKNSVEQVFTTLTDAGIPTCYGLKATATALRKVVDYHRQLIR